MFFSYTYCRHTAALERKSGRVLEGTWNGKKERGERSKEIAEGKGERTKKKSLKMANAQLMLSGGRGDRLK